jgi:pimeloyl-ACP methyl ester carboxylesterase
VAWGSTRPTAELADPELAYERARGLARAGTWHGHAADGGVRWSAVEGDCAGERVAQLCRFRGRDPNKTPALLVHGASAWRATFMEPHGGLLRHLLRERDVWTLDWRASKLITEAHRARAGAVPQAVRAMDLDLPAAEELPSALDFVAAHGGAVPNLLGHCMGAALIAMALARGQLQGRMPRSVVLSALGLFYRGAVDSWFRAEERLDAQLCAASDPWYLDFASPLPLPAPYQQVFELWRQTPYRHCEQLFCQRISAILGCPYRPDDLGYLHDAPLHADGLASQFGVMPIGILNHCARNVRRGWSAARHADDADRRDLAHPERFAALEKLSLITGSENQLWHRDSIDRMHEWLGRLGPWQRTGRGEPRLDKRVFARFGHQDLFLSPLASAPGSVYDYVCQRL